MHKRLLNILTKISEFFPFHLLFSHVRYNLIMLLYWAFLFAVINNQLGQGLGLPYLFLSPEYMGHTSSLAFLFLGVGIGGFIMAYHIYSYIQIGPRYSFIATLYRPFYKFLLNNSLIPFAFMINISVNIYLFQKGSQYVDTAEIMFFILSLNGGALGFVILSLLYFIPTNKDLFKITGKKQEEFHGKSSNIQTTLHRHQTWYRPFMVNTYALFYYLNSDFRIKRSRSSAHYDVNILNKVFAQNHINASIFEIFLVISFAIIGLFRGYAVFQLPAGVSIMMLLTIIIMLVSALFSWFKSWTIPFVFLILILINYLNTNTNFFQFKSYAYGLSYEKDKLIEYDQVALFEKDLDDSIIQRDMSNYIATLENWKKKTGKDKPKLIILNSSGGGSRSAMWTFKVLQVLDSITQKEVSEHIQMMTGASGGMVGAAYYRDLILMENDSLIKSRLDKQYLDNISKDLLNRLSFTLATSDLFFRFIRKEINGHEYIVDRGYEFEQQLMDNLDGAFNRTLGGYEDFERQAIIPTMILTPSIINDGRRLIVGSQQHGYLRSTAYLDDQIGLSHSTENIEYLKFFEKNRPQDLNFTTALRMSATFPYIMPMISMPTSPEMYIMDAGIRDNYGYKLTTHYLLTLREWIKNNTSGVIILRIRDNKKDLMDSKSQNVSLYKRFILPFGNMYGNFLKMQDFNQDELMSTMVRSVDFPVNVVTFNLREEYQNRISLSWHLTEQEKTKVNAAINSKANQESIQSILRLLQLISEEKK